MFFGRKHAYDSCIGGGEAEKQGSTSSGEAE